MVTEPKTTKDRLVGIASRSTDLQRAVLLMDELASLHRQGVNPASALALYLIGDLYSEASTTQANINRITMNLEAAADDLLSMSALMKDL